jgi:hypothetical protein
VCGAQILPHHWGQGSMACPALCVPRRCLARACSIGVSLRIHCACVPRNDGDECAPLLLLDVHCSAHGASTYPRSAHAPRFALRVPNRVPLRLSQHRLRQQDRVVEQDHVPRRPPQAGDNLGAGAGARHASMSSLQHCHGSTPRIPALLLRGRHISRQACLWQQTTEPFWARLSSLRRRRSPFSGVEDPHPLRTRPRSTVLLRSAGSSALGRWRRR